MQRVLNHPQKEMEISKLNLSDLKNIGNVILEVTRAYDI